MTARAGSLRFSIFLPLAMLLLVGSSAMFWISNTARSSHENADSHQQQVTRALEVVVATETALSAFNAYVEEVTSFDQIIPPDDIATSYDRLSENVLNNIRELSDHVEMGVDEELISRLEADARSWVTDAKFILGLQPARRIPTAESLAHRRDQIQSSMALIFDLARQYEERAMAQNRARFRQHMTTAQLSLIALLIAGGIIAFFRANHLASALQRLSSDIARIRDGQFDVEVADIKRNDEIGDMARNVASFSDDLRELTATKEHVEYLALHDPLTGLRNRRCMDRKLEELQLRTDADKDVAALHIDLDRFKIANDTYGHHAGDAILKQIAQVLTQTVSADDLIFRVGGDEFLVLSRDNANQEDAARLARAIIDGVSAPILYGGVELQVCASVGIAFYSQSESDPELLLSNADLALYDAKGAGRGRYEFSSKARRIQRERRREMLDELKQGLQRDEFVIFFQPQVDVTTQRVVGLEALLRWHHPERGILSPAHFLDLAMESGLGDEITDICIDQSIAALKSWRDLELDVESVSINLAASQLQNPDLVDRLHGRVCQAQLEPSDLAIEIVESVLFGERDDLAIAQVRKLRALGYRIELDDFGTGHASISNLTRFKVDKIKIDRTFVSGVNSNREKHTIVAALVDLARNLGIECLAEGVETSEESDALLSIGCRQMQGYAVSRPAPLSEATHWLLARDAVNSQSLKNAG